MCCISGRLIEDITNECSHIYRSIDDLLFDFDDNVVYASNGKLCGHIKKVETKGNITYVEIVMVSENMYLNGQDITIQLYASK